MLSPELTEEIAYGQTGVTAADDDCLYLFGITTHHALSNHQSMNQTFILVALSLHFPFKQTADGVCLLFLNVGNQFGFDDFSGKLKLKVSPCPARLLPKSCPM
jgi:hypothetical protein